MRGVPTGTRTLKTLCRSYRETNILDYRLVRSLMCSLTTALVERR
jgi:hypothetical protein